MINSFLNKPLNKFLLWLFGIFIVCFIGITNVFALTNKTIYSGNSDGTLINANYYSYGYINPGGVESTSIASVGQVVSGKATGFLFFMYETVTTDKTYTIKVNFNDIDLLASVNSGNFILSSCNYSTCNPGVIVSFQKQNNNSNSQWLIIKFNPTSAGSIIKFDSGSFPNYMTGVSNFGISSVQIEINNPQQDIINNQTNNTNNIINNNNSNTQEIINNQDSNTQDIINNNNSVGQSIIDNQNSIAQQQQEQQQSCFQIDKTDVIISGKYLSPTGAMYDLENYGVTDYFNVYKAKIKVLTTLVANTSTCFYNTNKELISCIRPTDMVEGTYLTVPTDAVYLRASINLGSNKPTFEVCKNGNQAMNDTLTDTSSTSFDISSINISSNTPITNLLSIPINLLNAILTSSSNSCSPISIPFFYNSSINFPCFTISDYLGSVANTIDLCICFVMIYNIFMLFISVFEDITSLRDGFLSLYEPRHAYTGYHPKHGKE